MFEDELIQVVGYIKQYPTEAVSPLACLRRIREDGISETFPNVDTAFRLVYLACLSLTRKEKDVFCAQESKESAAFNNFRRQAM